MPALRLRDHNNRLCWTLSNSVPDCTVSESVGIGSLPKSWSRPAFPTAYRTAQPIGGCMDVKQPWSKWFWADWRSEPRLRMCSLGARGLWMDMLCICAESNPPGYLMINQKVLTNEDVANLVGASLEEVERLDAELRRNGVYSIDRRQCRYSRRMVKDHQRRRKNRDNGKMGGNPNLRKTTTKTASDNPQKPEAISHMPEARYNTGLNGSISTVRGEPPHEPSPPLPPPPPDDASPMQRDAKAEVLGCLGIAFDDPRWYGHLARVERWLAEGADLDRDILPTIKRIMSKRDGPPGSLRYFEPAIMEAMRRNTAPMLQGEFTDGERKEKSNKRDHTNERRSGLAAALARKRSTGKW